LLVLLFVSSVLSVLDFNLGVLGRLLCAEKVLRSRDCGGLVYEAKKLLRAGWDLDDELKGQEIERDGSEISGGE